MPESLRRLAPLTGIPFAVLLAVAFASRTAKGIPVNGARPVLGAWLFSLGRWIGRAAPSTRL